MWGFSLLFIMEPNPRLIHPALDGVVLALELLKDGASALSEAVRQRKASRVKQPRRGQTLRAGSDTPLWNALVVAINAQCTKRGDKSKLARLIGLPRQRMHDFLHGNGPLPDAERTLMLFQWLVARNKPAGKPSAKA